MECLYCKKQMMFPALSVNGCALCGDCKKDFPLMLVSGMKKLDKEDVENTFLYYKDKIPVLRNDFTETIHYGKCSVDARNGYVCFCERNQIDKDGKPEKSVSDIFLLKHIKKIQVDYVKHKYTNGKIPIDIYFDIVLRKNDIKMRKLIKKNVYFKLEKRDDGNYYLKTPDDFDVFLDFINGIHT